MNPIFAAALELQRFCAERGWRNASGLDRGLVLGELAPLLELKGDSATLDRVRNLLDLPPR